MSSTSAAFVPQFVGVLVDILHSSSPNAKSGQLSVLSEIAATRGGREHNKKNNSRPTNT